MSQGKPNAKLEAAQATLNKELQTVLNHVETNYCRSIGRKSYACAVSIYDRVGNKGSVDSIMKEVQSCMIPHQRAQDLIGKEVNSFQGRFTSAEGECQYRAQDMVIPYVETTPEKHKEIEATYEKCILTAIEKQRKMIPVTKERIHTALHSLQASPEMHKVEQLTKQEYKKINAFSNIGVMGSAAAPAASSESTSTEKSGGGGGGWLGGWFGSK